MKKTYQIEVDCANCANLMEQATKKTEGVTDAVVNFMTQKMTVEFAEGQDPKAVMKAVLKTARRSRTTARSISKASSPFAPDDGAGALFERWSFP